ncbi:MAG: beta-galactosidase small subunit [Clostridiales bacterium]|nr:beta-galactosidase small subunit [Clostridiales bacterium]
MDCTNKIQIVYGDLTLGVKGEGWHVIFNYGRGGIESLVAGGREWMYRCPQPTFWRALTDNDRGSRFHLKSGCWLAADTFIRQTGVSVAIDGKEIAMPIAPENNRYSPVETAESAAVTYEFETLTVPAAKVTVTYTATCAGVNVKAKYFGAAGLPQLPVFGLRMIMPTHATGFTYEGLSGETYPDRMAGGVEGVYEVKGLPVTPYMVPQDCGMHMNTKWVEVRRNTQLANHIAPAESSLKIAMDEKPFAFSCLPYTAEELENATHHEELPPARRTVLCVYGAVRGVGGIDSWGSDVEEAYHLSAEKDYEVSFNIAL